MLTYGPSAARAEQLGTSLAKGLDAAAVEASRASHGPNRLPDPVHKTVFQIFLGALNDKTLFVLMGAAAVAIGVEVLRGLVDDSHTPHYLDGAAILAAVVVASFVTTLNEARAAKQFRELSRARDEIPIKTLRDGHVHKVSIYDLVVGDVVHFDPGDRLPADGVLVSGVDVTIDESTLTGESMPAEKGEHELDLKGGTVVSTGHGTMLLTAVGRASEIGKLQLTLTEEEETETPLQERLSKLADRIGLFGLAAAVLTFLALSISAFVRGELPFQMNLAVAGELLEFLIVAVTIIVVAVPEGLPLAVTISLSYSVRKMAKDHNLVRKLASCETMGAATVICSDKTGTLTKNRMSVVSAWIGGKRFDEAPAKSEVPPALAERFADIVSINSTAFLERGRPSSGRSERGASLPSEAREAVVLERGRPSSGRSERGASLPSEAREAVVLEKTEAGELEYVGNPTECALLVQLEAWGEPWHARRDAADVVHQHGFTSDRKRMSTVLRQDGGAFLLVKGAPEVVLERCTQLVNEAGDTEALEDADRQALTEQLEALSRQGNRALGLAYRALDEADVNADAETVEQGLAFLALVGIADPVRPEVEEAVRTCREAGVEVKMITGDNPLTARSIAEQIGLLTGDELVVEGKAIREMSDEELTGLLPKIRVVARSVPSDKHRLVTLLKASGEVVAVTGDGTNDAPALKAADVGFSMGITGTEVAKEASDIVLLDDNFASIVNAVMWGRAIFENIRKFLQFQLTVNVVALSTAFLAAVTGFGIPLNTVQLLWVNLIMDTMAALALATEAPTRALLAQPPHGRHQSLISASMWINVFVMGFIMLAVLGVTMWTDLIVGPEISQAVKLTFVFNTFVMMQVFNEVNARSTRFDRGVLGNLRGSGLFAFVMITTVVLQIGIIQYGGAFFRTVPLTGELWMKSVVIGASILVAGVLLRACGRLLPAAWLKERERAAI